MSYTMDPGAVKTTRVRVSRRCASLRHHVGASTATLTVVPPWRAGRGRQTSLELKMSGGGEESGAAGSSSSADASQPHQQPPKRKSNWEVIEHFSGRPPHSSSLIGLGLPRAASIKEEEEGNGKGTASGTEGEERPEDEEAEGKEDVESLLLATSASGRGGSTRRSRSRADVLRLLLARICRSHRFKNLQVEMLYQRYFLRTNQSNMTHLLGLLLALCTVLASLHLATLLMAPEAAPGAYATFRTFTQIDKL
ncbi:uncharacterized protein LOC126212662 [Schistocerca nitens]|uniref:uncharacterized protein LOC126212662 n=1 Tax=Schistocerca nitens TaxID=7011 RepID=UPI0021193D17|nr:uncharacterized protein LOC126212662 [Schistocerca nitens]